MPDGLSALFWGVVTFSLLVVIHEGGHFLAARMLGVKVHEFMVGLPGPALRFHAKKTTYGITAIPLGGYVRIAGMEPGPEDPLLAPALAVVTRRGTADAATVGLELGIEDEQADRLLLTLADWDALEQVEGEQYEFRSRFAPEDAEDTTALLDRARSVTYRALSTGKRVIVLSAGVVLNLLTAVLVFTLVLTVFGRPQPTLAIAEVSKDSAAAESGLRAGDVVTSIDGRTIEEWTDVTETIAENEPGDEIKVVVVRDGAEKSVNAVLGTRPGTDQPMLGIGPEFEQVRLGIIPALLESFSYIGLTFVAIAGFFNPATFSQSIGGASSVIGASYVAAEAARSGPIDYAAIVALLSLSLGVINVLPIPPLDGGKIAVELLERVAHRQLPRNVSLAISATGAILLFALIGYLMYSDVLRFIVNG